MEALLKTQYALTVPLSFMLAFVACKSYPTSTELSETRRPAAVGSNPHAGPQGTGKFINLPQDPGLMTGMKQLTFVGPRSGEGYFSKDGKKMIFQSERSEGNPFYQIYVLDMETGKTHRVSPGAGKTTCAWIHPDGKKALFGSTHLDPNLKNKVKEEIEGRKSPQKNKYSWSFDDQFDIFEANLDGKNLKRLTKEKGYDAEGDYSPDGKQIVFASNRAAYTETLSDEDKKHFVQDPSYMMDIYIMNADGSNVRRLTNVKGYDGGPFFSADGKKITWRRFTPNGQTAEAYTMNIDGSDQKQITDMGAMSWAPYFHPSGDYLIFTSNALGFSNFELFIVDAKGERNPVRVSYLDDFDGLPVFTPDGKKLAWTHKNEKGESQIYLADWDDAKARKLLSLSEKEEAPLHLTSVEIVDQDAKAWVYYLAGEHLSGRMTGSAEEIEYTGKIAEAFKNMGLVPAEGSSFLVPFTFTSGVELGSKNSFEIKVATSSGMNTVSGKVNEDFVPLSFSQTGDFGSAPVVFAGYGITAPANEKHKAYDSYQGLDVKGKWVLAFRDIPENIPNEQRVFLNIYSRPQHKALVAKNLGAMGLILINGPNAFSKKLVKLKYEGALSSTSIALMNTTDAMAEKMVAGSGKTLKQWQDANDNGEIVTGELKDVQISANVDLNLKKSQGLNVIAKLPVSGAKTAVMFGAHGDHLGRGEAGTSLARPEEQGLPNYGADDNASGVAATLEIAEHTAHLAKTGKLKLKQDLMFAIWSGEEIGILGSTHYLEKRKGEKITSYLNMDMVGRLRQHLIAQGVASAKEWKGEIESLAVKSPLSINQQDDPYVPSDAMAFYVKGIPAIHFFTGSHAEYHTPRDRPETLNYSGISQVAKFVEGLGLNLAGRSQGLTYVKVESSRKNLEGRSFRIYLGTIPDYTQEGIKGVKISGTPKDSPAEKAGLKSGDVIVEIANTKIQNLYDYVYCLQAMKANQPTIVKVERQGKMMELPITPTLKE